MIIMRPKTTALIVPYLRDAFLGVHLHHDIIRYTKLCTLRGDEAAIFRPILAIDTIRGPHTFQLVRDR